MFLHTFFVVLVLGNKPCLFFCKNRNFVALQGIWLRYRVIQKKIVQRAFLNHVDCLEQKKFLQWNTSTKDYLCANFQDILLLSKSWILDIKYAMSAIKMQIWINFFAKRFTILLLYVWQVFINLHDHLHFFLHFVFSFMGQLFMDDPILRLPERIQKVPPLSCKYISWMTPSVFFFESHIAVHKKKISKNAIPWLNP